jgi:Tfp pilus assembly protein PilP
MRRKHKPKNSAVLPLVCGCFLFLLSGAAASEAAIHKDAGAKKQMLQTQGVDESASVLGKVSSLKKSSDQYVYVPTGKTDPFKSFIAEQEAIEEKKQKKPKTYLETLDLSQLELVAIVLNAQKNWAMVRDAKGLGHMIVVGTAIGTNGGVVRQIKDREVIIHEEYKDFRGKMITKDIKKRLPSLE